MNHRYMLWSGHLAVLILLAGGFWWLTEQMPGMPDSKLIVALVAMTALVFNHHRWWSLGKKVSEKDILDKIDLLVVANYCILVLVLSLVSFRR